MPIVLSPEHNGWMRVPPPKRRNASPAKQADALKSGALSYFACQSTSTSPTKPNRLPPCPKYDLDSPPHSPRKKKSRVVSAPVVHEESDREEEDDFEPETDYISARPSRRTGEGRRTVSAAPRAPVVRREESSGQSKYWTGPSNRNSSNRTPPAAQRSNYARSNVSERWASATQPLNL